MSEGEVGAPATPFAHAAASLALSPAVALAAEQVLEGAPAVAERALWSSADGRVQTGLWEITPGVCTDVEADEVFLVLSGRAVVEVDGGPRLVLAPGIVGSFPAGARTIWRVSETLRKLYTVTLG